MQGKIARALLLSTVWAAPVFAQESPFEPNAIFLGTLTFNGASSDAINDKDVGAQELERKNPTDLADLFKSEPTIAVGGTIPMTQKVYVNGVEESRLGVTVDGARQNNKIFHHNSTHLIDPALLKSVRVDPGVAPADAGPGALAGVLAYETKDVDDLLTEGDNIGGRAKLEYDFNSGTTSTSIAGYGRHNGFEALVFLKNAQGSEFVDGSGNDIDGTSTNLDSGVAKIAYQAESGERIELSFEKVVDEAPRPYRANLSAIISDTATQVDRDYKLERTNTVLTFTDESPEGWWDPKFQLAFSKSELETDDIYGGELYGGTQSFSGTFQNTFAIQGGSITAGLDFFQDKAEADFVYAANPAWDEDPIEKLENIGIFAQARLEPTEQLRLSFGFRADERKLTGVDGSTHEDSGVSTNISAEFDVTDAITISGGYSHVWGGLDMAENFVMSDYWTYDGEFSPVTADNYFLAFDAEFGQWSFDGKLFNTRINNARNSTYRGGPQLSNDLVAQGFEIGAGYNWASGYVKLGYAEIITDIDGTRADGFAGNYLTIPMGQILTLEALHDFGTGVRVGGDIEHAFRNTRTYRETEFSSDPTYASIDPYTVANAFVEYTPDALNGAVIRAEVNNIFDENYVSRASYGQEYQDVDPINEPGRNFRISLSYEF